MKTTKTIASTTLIALGLFALALIPSQLLTQETLTLWLDNTLPKNTFYQSLALVVCLTSVLTVGVPRQFAAIACGYVLGAKLGFLTALLSATLACLLTALIARKLLSQWVLSRFEKQQQAIYQFLSINEFTKALIIRLMPVGSNFLTNIVAGACKIKLKPFVLGSMLGFMPQMIVFSLVGAGIKLSSEVHLFVAASLFILALILGIWLYKKEKKRKRGNVPNVTPF